MPIDYEGLSERDLRSMGLKPEETRINNQQEGESGSSEEVAEIARLEERNVELLKKQQDLHSWAEEKNRSNREWLNSLSDEERKQAMQKQSRHDVTNIAFNERMDPIQRELDRNRERIGELQKKRNEKS